MTSKKTTIRLFRASEFDDWKVMWDAYYKDGKENLPPSRIKRKIWNDMLDKQKGFRIYGVWYDGQPAGFMTVVSIYTPHAAKPLLYLSDLYVMPEFRQKKLGTKLLKTLFEKEGPKHCHIEWKTRVKNVVARHLYKKYANRTNWVIYERQTR